MNRARLLIAPLTIACVMAGCPRSFDPAAAPNLTSPDPQANSAFATARRLFDGGALIRADKAFENYARSHPADKLVPHAHVYRGRIALRQRAPKRAMDILAEPAKRPVGDEAGLQARYYLGLASVRHGAHAEGRRLLLPFLKVVKDDKLPPVLVALAHASMQLKDHAAATARLARLHAVTDRPAEKAYARQHLERLVDRDLNEAQVTAAHGKAAACSLLSALTGRRLARTASAGGKAELAARYLRDTADARARHLVILDTPGAPRVQAELIGLMVPTRGRYRLAGKQLLAGALEGARAFETPGSRKVTLVIRDSSKDPAAVARRLLEQRGVVALAGTLSPTASRAVAAVAAQHGAPFVSLAGSRAGNNKARSTLRIFPTNAARAEALARHAAGKLALKRAVILAPGSPYGVLMARAFARAFRKAGGKVSARMTYPRRATSFADQAKKLKAMEFEALFVPDTVRTLTLIAPAMAKVGLWSSPASKGKRTYRLLATGEGISSTRLAAAARYLEAAVLAPGYFPVLPAEGAAPTAVSSFVTTHGRPPTLVEAFAFDAVHVLRSHMAPALADRLALLGKLRTAAPSHPAGLTGKIAFDAAGERSDPPMMFKVEGGKLVGL